MFANGVGAGASFYYPTGVAVDSSGNVIVADYNNHRIRKVTPGGVVTTLAGSTYGFADGTGTGASFYFPTGVAVDSSGNVIVADSNNHRIRKVTPGGVVTTLAGGGSYGFSDGAGAGALFMDPSGVAVDSRGNVIVADRNNHRIRKLTPGGVVTTLAGSGSATFADGTGAGASFNWPAGVAVDNSGNVIVADQRNHRIRKLTPGGVVTTLAGSDTRASADGTGAGASFNFPTGVAVDSSGNVVVVDSGNNRIRKVTPGGVVSTLAGSQYGFADGTGTSAKFYDPRGVTLDSSGNVIVADGGNHRIRKISVLLSPTPSGTRTFTPTRSPSKSRTRTPSSSTTLSLTRTPTLTRSCTPSGSETPSQTASLGSSASTTPSPTTSPTATPSPTTTQTLSSSASASTTGSPSSSPSSSVSPSSSARSSSSPSDSFSARATFSSRASGTTFSTQSSTATPTPPPFSCLSRAEGCASPALSPSSPRFSSGAPLLPAPLFSASWPFVSASATLLFPWPPSPGEALLARCAALPAGSATVTTPVGAPLPTCAPSIPGEVCLAPPSSAAAAPPPAAATLLLLPLPAPAPPPTSLSCTLFSTPLQPPDLSNLPRYGASTTVTLPIKLAESTAPLLAAILAEGRGGGGAFRVVGGVGAGAPLAPAPPPLLAASGAAPNATPEALRWSDPAVGANATLLAPLLSLVAPLRAAPPAGFPPSLSATLSGATHLLLLLSPASPPFTPETSVTLNGFPCTLNWVAPGGSLASVTTPALSTLCGGAAQVSDDCGAATLLLTAAAGDPLDALLAQLRSGAPTLTLPAAYPPLLPPAALNDTALGALVGLPLSSLLPLAASLTPAGAGFRLVTACTDPSFAPPEACALVGGSPPPPFNASLGPCAWGSGDACVPCPSLGALCPGGAQLLPLPGYWAPAATARPADLTPCPEPDAGARCPGWRAAARAGGLYGCGAGFRGAACAACAPGFFPARGTCAPCPTADATIAQAAPLLAFLGGLVGAGALLVGVAYRALGARGGETRRARLLSAGAAVGDLLVWAWLAAQGAAALFAQAQALAPPALAPAFGAVAALQFKGVALAPACYNAPPFAAFWGAFGVVCGCAAASGGALLVTAFLGKRAAAAAGRGPESVAVATAAAPPRPRPLRVTALVLQVATLALTLGYGAITSTVAETLTCTLAAPMSLSAYALANSDGRALREALGASAPPLGDLRAAAGNPLLAASLGLTAALRASIPVSVLASDPYTVCREGPHSAAWAAAAALAVLYTLGLPAAMLGALWAGGRCKGARRALAAARKAPPPPQPPPARPSPAPALAALLATLADPALHPRAAWLPPAQLLLTSLFTGVVAVSVRARDAGGYGGAQAVVAGAALAGAALVWRLRPYVTRQAWRRPVLAALYALTAATAVVSGALYGGRGAAPGGAQWALGVALLLAAGGVFGALLFAWHRALLRGGGALPGGAPLQPLPEPWGGAAVTVSPLQQQPLASAPPEEVEGAAARLARRARRWERKQRRAREEEALRAAAAAEEAAAAAAAAEQAAAAEAATAVEAEGRARAEAAAAAAAARDDFRRRVEAANAAWEAEQAEERAERAWAAAAAAAAAAEAEEEEEERDSAALDGVRPHIAQLVKEMGAQEAAAAMRKAARAARRAEERGAGAGGGGSAVSAVPQPGAAAGAPLH
jgi:sugar lactone lactonase YvrE